MLWFVWGLRSPATDRLVPVCAKLPRPYNANDRDPSNSGPYRSRQRGICEARPPTVSISNDSLTPLHIPAHPAQCHHPVRRFPYCTSPICSYEYLHGSHHVGPTTRTRRLDCGPRSSGTLLRTTRAVQCAQSRRIGAKGLWGITDFCTSVVSTLNPPHVHAIRGLPWPRVGTSDDIQTRRHGLCSTEGRPRESVTTTMFRLEDS